MNLLVVLVWCPYPPRTGSGNVAYHNIKELSAKHAIDIVCADASGADDNMWAKVARRFEVVTAPANDRPWYQRHAHLALNLLLGTPVAVTSSRSAPMCRRVRQLWETGSYDAILLYDMTTIQYCPESAYSKILVNIEDPQSLKLARMLELDTWSAWERIKLRIFAKVTQRYEKRMLPRMGRVLLLSEADLSDLNERLAATNLGLVPYGTEQAGSRGDDQDGESGAGVIVFSGNMNNAINIDGLTWFLRSVFPAILSRVPSAILWIVGAAPDERIRRAVARFKANVVITGRVERVSDYLRRARVSICPIRLRIGVQTKVLESLACGTPVVTTTAGNRGVAGRTGVDLWAEDDPERFAVRVVGLLHGEDWRRFSSNGRQLAERFSWQRSASELESHVMAVVGKTSDS